MQTSHKMATVTVRKMNDVDKFLMWLIENNQHLNLVKLNGQGSSVYFANTLRRNINDFIPVENNNRFTRTREGILYDKITQSFIEFSDDYIDASIRIDPEQLEEYFQHNQYNEDIDLFEQSFLTPYVWYQLENRGIVSKKFEIDASFLI